MKVENSIISQGDGFFNPGCESLQQFLFSLRQKQPGPKGLIKRFDQTFSKVWPPAGPPEAQGPSRAQYEPCSARASEKNDAAACGKPAHAVRGTQDGQENRTKKNLNLSILEPGKSNRRTSLPPTANFFQRRTASAADKGIGIGKTMRMKKKLAQKTSFCKVLIKGRVPRQSYRAARSLCHPPSRKGA